MHPINTLIIFISTEYPGYSSGWKFYLSIRETCNPVYERRCPVRKRNLVYDYQKCQQMMLTGVAEGYWHIHGGPLSSGLQGALFTQILCSSLFRLWALSDISAYLTRTVETETTRGNIVCHSIRTVLAVRWHHIRAIALRWVSFLVVVARGRPGRGRPNWNLLCWYLRLVLLTLHGLRWS